MTAQGTFTEYYVPGGFYNTPYDIVRGPENSLWFTENQVGGDEHVQITPDGQMTEFPVPDVNAKPTSLAAGPDGAIWFTAYGSCNIGRLTTSGVFTEYGAGDACPPIGITAGPDGAMWFTGENWGCYPNCAKSTLGRITTAGVITEFPVPTLTSSVIPFSANGIVAGPDGNLWLAEANGNEIERAPVCALSLSASYANKTLTTNFDISTDKSAVWSILAQNTLVLQRSIPVVMPPTPSTLTWSLPDEGEVTVRSLLSTSAGQVICSEWTSLLTTP